MSRVKINRQAIAQMTREIQREFDRHPIRIPVQADTPTGLGAETASIVYNGPVFHGSADGAQLAWGNHTVHQTQNRTDQVTPGFEALALAVVKTRQGLPAAGLSETDQEDAQTSADDVLRQVVEPEPDRGLIRRALRVLTAILTPVAAGTAAGAEQGAQEWARTAIDQLSKQF